METRLYRANSILTQSLGHDPSPVRSTHYTNHTQRDPRPLTHYSSNIQDTPALVSSPSLHTIQHSVNIAEKWVSAGSSGGQENVLLDGCNSSPSTGLSPASDFAVVAGKLVRTRVFLKTDEEKAQLVRLCIANFGDFVSGKKRFWSKIGTLYQNLHPEEAAPNVKGYMQRYSVQRKKEIEEALGKSEIAESATEWQQSMDHWLELVRISKTNLRRKKIRRQRKMRCGKERCLHYERI